MTLESEKRFVLLLSSFYNKANSTKVQILDYIEENKWLIFSDNDLRVKHNRNELIWRNDLAFIRKHLVMEGYYIAGERNNWGITKKGEKYLGELIQQISVSIEFKKLSPIIVEKIKKGEIVLSKNSK